MFPSLTSHPSLTLRLFVCSTNTSHQRHSQEQARPNHQTDQLLLSFIHISHSSKPLVLLLNLIPVDGSGGEHLGERCAILQVIHDPVQGDEGEKQVNNIS